MWPAGVEISLRRPASVGALSRYGRLGAGKAAGVMLASAAALSAPAAGFEL
jgi:hypothetical protein